MVGLELGRVENMVEKGENARNKYFLLLAQCFQNLSTSELFRAGAFDIHNQESLFRDRIVWLSGVRIKC